MAQRGGPAGSVNSPRPVVRPENLQKPETHVVYSTTETANCPLSRTVRDRKTLRTTLLVAAGLAALSAGILGAPWLADHTSDIIFGLCIVLLGIVCGAMLAVKA